MRKLFRLLLEIKEHKTAFLIIFHNLLPIAGIVFLDWDPFSIVMIYVAETIIIGIVNVFKIFSAQAPLEEKGKILRAGIPMKIFICLFFLFHYNFFTFMQLNFIVPFRQHSDSAVSFFINYFLRNDELKIVMLFIAVSHFVSYIYDFMLSGKYKTAVPMILMFVPYVRIFIQQILGIIGGMLMLILGAPAVMFVLLQILKTVADVLTHVFLLKGKGKIKEFKWDEYVKSD